MADNVVTIDIELELNNINKQLDSLKTNAEKQGKELGGTIAKGVVVGLAAFEIGKKAFNEITNGLSGAVDEAIQAQKALNLFNQSLANAGNFSEGASKKFQEFADNLSKVSGVADNLIISNASILASLGRLSGEGLERATQAAIDFAATGRVSLEGAFDAIAKAANGNTGALSRYGIKVNESLSSTEKFSSALKQLEERFGGLAAAQGQTFEGALTRIGLQFQKIQEEIGNLIIKNKSLVAILNFVAAEFAKVSAEIQKLGSSPNFVNNIIQNLILVGGAITSFVLVPLEIVANALTTAALGFSYLKDVITGNFAAAKTSLDAFTLSAQSIFSTESSNKIQEFLLKVSDVAAAAPALAKNIENGVGGGFTAAADKAAKAADQINKVFQQGVVNSISVGAQAIGASLVKGGKAFENFGKQVLNIFGDLAISMGTTILLSSTAIQALKASIFGNAAPGIAAGIALIAFGGLLKALSGGGEGSGVAAGTPGSAGGDVGGGAVGGGGVVATVPEAEVKPESRIVVNVEGNVFNQRESGLEIARIIQEQFDLNGSVIAQGATV